MAGRDVFQPGGADGMNTAFPQYRRIVGTNAPVPCLSFDAGSTEKAYWWTVLKNYSSGPSMDLHWWSHLGQTTGDVRWNVRVAKVTPDGNESIEGMSFAAVNAVTATAGGTAKEPMKATISLSNWEGSDGDLLCVEISRDHDHLDDDMSGDANLKLADFTYS